MLILVSDFLSEKIDVIQDIINSLPRKETSFQLSILIELYALSNNNSIATLALSNHDLSNVRLSGYKLFEGSNCLTLDNCKISSETFSIPGLTMASSTITSYSINNNVFLIAFCKTSFLIYNVNKNNISIHILEHDINDINCCCNILIDNVPCILLGTDNGQIHLYHTDTRTLEEITGLEIDKNPIWSIVDTNQGIFYTKKINDNTCKISLLNTGKINVSLFKLHLSAEFCNNTKIKEIKELAGSWRIQAKLASSPKNIFCVYGDKLYSYRNNEFHEIYLDISDKTIDYKMFIDVAVTKSCIFINNVENILVFSLIEKDMDFTVKFIGKISINNYKNKSGDFFTKFSQTQIADTILVGIGIRRSELRGDVNFIEIFAKCKSERRKQYELLSTPIHGKHKSTTYTGTYFSIANDKGAKPRRYLATVSDDRSIQILEMGNEDFDIIQIMGEYNGIRSIRAIDEHTLVCGGYDGCLSKWECIDDEWYCTCTCKVHNNWIEAINLFSYDKHDTLVLSVSLDGHIILTELDRCISRVVLTTSEPIKDFDILIDCNKISILACTKHSIFSILGYKLNQLLNDFNDDNSISSLVKDKDIHIINLDSKYISKAVSVKSMDEPLCLLQYQSKESEIHKISNDDYNLIESLDSLYAHHMAICNDYLVISGFTNGPLWGCLHLFCFNTNDNKYKKLTEFKFEYSTEIADLVIQETNEQIIIHTIHKDKKYSMLTFDKNGNLSNQKTVIFDSSEPVCLSVISEKIFIGTKNGEVLKLESDTTKKIIQMRANLISNGEIKIDGASDEFMSHFKGYFLF